MKEMQGFVQNCKVIEWWETITLGGMEMEEEEDLRDPSQNVFTLPIHIPSTLLYSTSRIPNNYIGLIYHQHTHVIIWQTLKCNPISENTNAFKS